MTTDVGPLDLCARLLAFEERLITHLADLRTRIDALDRRVDQRVAEVRAKQEEDLILLKAMSCQLRGRVERAERRAVRGGF